MSRIRRKLTYANVVSTLCLFIVLGGGAYAASKLKNNSVTTQKIRNGAVSNSKLADGAVTSSKLADGAVSRGKLASGISQCPGAMTKVLVDLCVDSTDRGGGGVNWNGAIEGCQAAGLRLPDGSEALAMDPLVTGGGITYWTEDVSSDTKGVYLSTLTDALGLQDRTNLSAYRCVATPTAP